MPYSPGQLAELREHGEAFYSAIVDVDSRIFQAEPGPVEMPLNRWRFRSSGWSPFQRWYEAYGWEVEVLSIDESDTMRVRFTPLED